MNCKIKLIQDGQANALIYDSSKRAGNLFFDFVEDTYKWKKQDKDMKIVLNILWGALCEKNHKIYRTTDDVNVDVIDNVLKGPKGYDLLETYNYEKVFKTNYARIFPFITSAGRKMIFDEVYEIIDDVYRINTDGFICSGDINLETSDSIGKLKVEYENKNVKIEHINKIICSDCNENIKICGC